MRGASAGGALLLGVVGIAAAALGGDVGCSPSKPTEIVPGALTQVRVPKDLAGITVEVLAQNSRKFCGSYAVDSQGIVLLPSTLGVIEGQANTTVTIVIRGYDTLSNDFNNCTASNVGDPTVLAQQDTPPRVLRRATLTYVNQHTLFLPMQLSFSCYDNKGCSDSQTCKGGKCVGDSIDATTLPDYDPSLLDGTQVCFSPSTCFGSSNTYDATLVDPSTCTYAVPQYVGGGAGAGLNVRIAYAQNTWAKDPGTQQYSTQAGAPFEDEILNQDADEGFIIDTSTPGQFKLAPGLCSLVQAGTAAGAPPAPSSGTQAYPVISNVQVGVGCAPKQLLLPFCSAQQNTNVNDNPPVVACGNAVPLNESPSAVYVVMDNSIAMNGAFGPSGYATAMTLSFADPVFNKTYVAFDFLHHVLSECPNPSLEDAGATTQYTAPKVDFALSGSVQGAIKPLVLNPTYTDTKPSPYPLDLGAALRIDDGAYRRVSDFVNLVATNTKTQNPINNPSLMVFVNRIPFDSLAGDAGTSTLDLGGDCPPTPPATTVDTSLANQVIAAGKAGIHTYFVVLDNGQGNGSSTLSYYNQVATDVANGGGSSSMVDVINATSSDQSAVFSSFQTTVAGAVTCVYDLPPGIDSTATLTVMVPPGTPGFPPSTSAFPMTIPPTSGCTVANKASSSVNGWGIDKGRVVLCGSACQEVELSIGQATLTALQDAGALTDAGIDFDGGTINIPNVPVSATMPCNTSP
jgi:hypothetical protein